VRKDPLPAVAAVISFIDAINRGDVERLGELMTEEHHLDVFDEAPLRGKAANVDVWHGYASAFPTYVISPHELPNMMARSRCSAIQPGPILGCPTRKKSDSC
jgi:hypothetical protein